MSLIVRISKFSMVGALGMLVQLAALALISRWPQVHFLYATVAALELTLLHNFVWHLNYTWRDRRNDYSLFEQLLRFQFSNGLVSLFGNVAFVRVLVREARFPLLLANGVAILCCSIANFLLGNKWAFAVKSRDLKTTDLLNT